MRRLIGILYGAACYAAFVATILYAIGFVANMAVPKSIDSGPAGPLATALIVDTLLLTLFGIQHSGMARRKFKEHLARFMPQHLERSTYVLLSSLALALLFWQWRPIPALLWDFDSPVATAALTALSMLGWLLVLSSSFLINHFELFGLRQVFFNYLERPMPQSTFRTPLFYRFVRHPIYLGFIIAFWSAPSFSFGHLLFAAGTTAYILVGIMLEERDLAALFGEKYQRYAARVPMLFPLLRSSHAPTGTACASTRTTRAD